MKFASSMPASRTGFEQTVYQLFGSDVSPEAVIAAVAFVGITLLFKTTLFGDRLS